MGSNLISPNLHPRWSRWLDRGALINVDAPGCGTSVVQGRQGTNRKSLIIIFIIINSNVSL